MRYIGSTHFTWEEVVRNSGYNKNLPLFLRPRARAHALNMEKLRTEVNRVRRGHHLPPTGIRMISWARSPQHNRAVGGASQSRHLKADACDISVQEIRRLFPFKGGLETFDSVANRIFKNGGFGQYPTGNRHVDSRGYRARWTTWRPSR